MTPLTMTQRRVLRLTVLEDLTYREAASRLGCSPKTIQAHVERAYALLGCKGGTKRDAALALGWGWPPVESVA